MSVALVTAILLYYAAPLFPSGASNHRYAVLRGYYVFAFDQPPKAFLLRVVIACIRASVREHTPKSFLYTIRSYKPFVRISPDLQLKRSRGQRRNG